MFMNKILIFLFTLIFLPKISYSLEPTFSNEEIGTLSEKIKTLKEKENKSDDQIWKEMKKGLLEPKRILKLRSYESNMLGYTWDDNDVGFMDFKLSLMYPLFHDGEYNEHSHDYYLPAPYIAFTGRFGQYINSRKSSPVIGKRFNPKIFLRYWLGNEQDYFDFGAAHESNGQRIDSAQAYQDLRNDFTANGEDPDFADDYISRGWDYWEIMVRKAFVFNEHKFVTLLNLKRFLDGGGLQGSPEEYNSWEGGNNFIPRKSVDGITVGLQYSTDFTIGQFSGKKIFLTGTTGYKDTFDYNSMRAEFTTQIFKIPLMFWGADGYQADLIDYYHRVKSYGVSLELKTYLHDF